MDFQARLTEVHLPEPFTADWRRNVLTREMFTRGLDLRALRERDGDDSDDYLDGMGIWWHELTLEDRERGARRGPRAAKQMAG
jgi:hypothetical protein